MGIIKKAKKTVGKVVSLVVNTVAQTSVSLDGQKPSTEKMKELCRTMNTEGAVLLKNENGVLPITKDRVVSVFGRVQRDYFYVGYGSGGDVNAPYKTNLIDALRACDGITVNENLAETYAKLCENDPVDDGFWGHWPMSYDEVEISESDVKQAAENSDTAVVVIGRAAGEDRENTLSEGSYYLTKSEKMLLDMVTCNFRKTVVLLDCGSVMDMSWVNDYGSAISSIIILWQGGMESTNAAADLLCGKVTPGGKLCDTIALKYEDYPSAKNFGNKDFNNYSEDIYVGYRYFETFAKNRVLYPFGYGLSYTDFEISVTSSRLSGDILTVFATVKNTGKTYSGKETVQLYVCPPNGLLGKPKRNLVCFKKTKLLAPGEEEKIKLTADIKDFASYDDSGITGHKNCYVLENGEYKIFVGNSVRDAKEAKSFVISSLRVVSELSQAAAPNPKTPFERLICKEDENGNIRAVTEETPVMKVSLKDRILNNLPKEVIQKGDLGYKLCDVKNGKVTMDEFVSQLSFDELEAISRGDYIMNSPLGAKGNAGAFGGVLQSLRQKGVPAMITTDGPSGIRLACNCSLLPNGAVLACSFNPELVTELYTELSKEMKDRGTDVLLAPGMNIHRNPLCGRNFEYFSEDPYISGVTAAAVINGIQSNGLSACPKHFACNNQETNRTHNDSRVSERALREIYLKGFEIAVKTAKPKNIMTSYNKINGVWGHYNYDLVTTILRGEWGYEGNVMTDWWMRSSKSPEFPNSVSDQAYRVRAGVDVLMPGGGRAGKRKPDGTMKKSFKKEDGITLGELQRTAKHVLRFAMEKSE